MWDVRTTVGFHNFNLRIFNLRVSNPNKLIVDVFLTRCRISMCQGLGPKKHDEISEIDRMFLLFVVCYLFIYGCYLFVICLLECYLCMVLHPFVFVFLGQKKLGTHIVVVFRVTSQVARSKQ